MRNKPPFKKIGKAVTITVGIAAYNAEKNIKRLLDSLLSQKSVNYKLDKVFVHSDQSTDNTDRIVKNMKNKYVKLIIPRQRRGFARTIINLLKGNKSDICILLNDDIIISDRFFINKLIQPYFSNKNVGLISGNPQALQSRNFISEAVRSGYNAYKDLGDYIDSGNNIFTCDGKILCFSKLFIKTLKFPKNKSEMGNVDKYIYLSCLANHFDYRYVTDAVVYFKCPSTIDDFVKWQIRNYKTNKYIMQKKFAKLSYKEYKTPRIIFTCYKIKEFMKNPLGGTVIYLLGLYCTFKAYKERYFVKTTWDLVSTTKDL